MFFIFEGSFFCCNFKIGIIFVENLVGIVMEEWEIIDVLSMMIIVNDKVNNV